MPWPRKTAGGRRGALPAHSSERPPHEGGQSEGEGEEEEQEEEEEEEGQYSNALHCEGTEASKLRGRSNGNQYTYLNSLAKAGQTWSSKRTMSAHDTYDLCALPTAAASKRPPQWAVKKNGRASFAL